MSTTPAALNEDQVRRATEILSAEPAICAAYLHGSAVKSGLRPDSDVDIAILPCPKSGFSADIQLRLSGDLSSIFSREVDLGMLSSSNVIYARQVIQYGRLLFTKSRYHSDLFVATSLAMYANLQIERREILRAYAA